MIRMRTLDDTLLGPRVCSSQQASQDSRLSRDITRQRKEEDLERPPSRRCPVALRDLALDRIRQGLCVFSQEGRLLLFNRQYAAMYDLEPEQLRIGMTLREVVDLRYAAGTGPGMAPEVYAKWRDRIGVASKVVNTEVTLRDGRVHSIHHEPTAGGGWVATFEDITERRQAEANVRYLAHHDTLTGLPNRHHFMERLEQTLEQLRGNTGPADYQISHSPSWLCAVLLLDLDRFKEVNDTLGHAAGDTLLRLVTGRIKQCLREEDTVARLGGDEFAVFLPNLAVARDAENTADRIIASVSKLYLLDGEEALIGMSAGIALCSDENDCAETAILLRHADLALYQAKSQGRGTWRSYQPCLHVALHRRKELERELRRALTEEGLQLHFQPITCLRSGSLIAAEALLRWRHPEYGDISPLEAVSLAESVSLHAELSAWVLRAACAHAKHWRGIRLAVNLSPEQVQQEGLVELVSSILSETGFPPGMLEVEITEGTLLKDTVATLATLTRLRRLGIAIALDDFGTGFSSLNYLRRFPFDKIKVDRSFVANASGDEATSAIVQAIVTMGRSLKMRVVAEGIESQNQLELMRSLGCDEAQGFLIGRPCLAADFTNLADGVLRVISSSPSSACR